MVFFTYSFCFGVIPTFKPANFVQHPTQTITEYFITHPQFKFI